MYDKTRTIEAFLDAAAARQATPGGGAVAALAGAMSAAMGEMTVHYSIGKKGLEQYVKTFEESLAALHRARQMFLRLMVEDQAAYEAMAEARKQRKDISKAATIGAEVPQTIAATAVSVLDICDKLADGVNRNLISDLSVCAELAMATTRAALANVRANLPDIADAKERDRIEATSAKLLAHATALIQRIAPRISKRMQ